VTGDVPVSIDSDGRLQIPETPELAAIRLRFAEIAELAKERNALTDRLDAEMVAAPSPRAARR